MFYFHPIRSKEPPILNFPMLSSAKYCFQNGCHLGLAVVKVSKILKTIGPCERYWVLVDPKKYCTGLVNIF